MDFPSWGNIQLPGMHYHYRPQVQLPQSDMVYW
jgi:hypothetical protein